MITKLDRKLMEAGVVIVAGFLLQANALMISNGTGLLITITALIQLTAGIRAISSLIKHMLVKAE